MRPVVVSLEAIDELFARLELEDGRVYQISRRQFGPLGIGQAKAVVNSYGYELPTPELIDLVWQCADLKIEPMPRTFKFWTAAEMAAPDVLRDQVRRIEESVGEREFVLLAGEYKDVVEVKGKIGLYGWHRLDGKPIQPFYAGHSESWIDYSQSTRLIERLR